MEDSEEAKEVSEAPKTSEVKTEVKTEGKEVELKDNSEAATVDEDQRKLFVGGLAQVILQFQKVLFNSLFVFDCNCNCRRRRTLTSRNILVTLLCNYNLV